MVGCAGNNCPKSLCGGKEKERGCCVNVAAGYCGCLWEQLRHCVYHVHVTRVPMAGSKQPTSLAKCRADCGGDIAGLKSFK